MTDQHHPLTDEKARSLFSFERLLDMSQPLEIEDCMRTAADWQLEQVIKWFKQSTSHYGGDCLYFDNHYDLDEGIENVLEKAMRPTTQEDN